MRILLLIGLLLFQLHAKSLFSNDDQEASSIYIGSLKDLMIATQKTRGLTNSYLNGNTAAQLLVYGTRKEMKKAIGKMESTTLAADPVINSRAVSISKALIKLNQKAFKQKPSEIFEAYTQQIEEILMLAQTVSQRSAKTSNACAKEASKIMMISMLPLTEYVGQLRGFGSGLAAKGKVNKSDKEKVSLLSYEIKTLHTDIQKELGSLMSQYNGKLPNSLHSDVKRIDTSIEKYLSLTEKLLKDPKSVAPDIYFDEGTAVITNIIKVYDTVNKAILENSKGWF